MRLRQATVEDAAPTVALWREAGLTRPWNDPDSDFLGAVNGDSSVVLLAVDGADLLGSVMVGDDGHRGWMYYLSVAAGSRGRGLGADLVRGAEEWLAQRGQLRIRLMVRNENDAVLGFYAGLGYVDQDCVVLGRTLDE